AGWPAGQGKRRRAFGVALCADDAPAWSNRARARFVQPHYRISKPRDSMTTIKPVFVELKRPSGDHPGHVLEGFFTIQKDIVLLVDRNGEAVKDEHPKTVAGRLLRTPYSATRHKSVNGFDGPIFYPTIRELR